MTRYAILVGAISPENGLQKSLVDFKDFLTSAAGGSWREDEIIICGQDDYGEKSQGAAEERGETDWSEKLRSVTENGRGVFIGDVCYEIVDARELGYEVTEKSEAHA